MSLKAKILKELEKKPRRLKELKAKLGNDKKVTQLVDELFHSGSITCRQSVYTIATPKTQHAVACRLVKLGRGFGFAKPDDGSLDVFIPGKYLMGAMPGDTVLVSVFDHPRVAGSVEGEVVAVTQENNRFVGTVQRVDGRLALVPDHCPQTPIFIKKSADGGACEGEKAAVEIIERGVRHEDHRAGVCMRFGAATEAKQCAKAILYGAGIETRFSHAVKEAAQKLDGASVTENDMAGRVDLRDLAVFTIDSDSTKDIDDAVSVERTEDGGYRLGVHIADVSHYVTPGSALDVEALKRGTSVYYADSVIPMLPKQLSNGICSLNPQVDRLAFSCLMEIDTAGCVTKYCFEKTVIRSRVKGVYAELNEIYAGNVTPELQEKYSEVWDKLPALYDLHSALAALRTLRGAMDIESGEAQLIIDASGKCVDVKKRTRGKSEQMIEEFMLLANNCAAAIGRQNELPFVYRVHETPDPNRVQQLKLALTAAGVDFKFAKDIPTATELARLLESTRNTPLERFVHTSVLRSMAKAKYDPEPKGHFGLSLVDYAHFTSPIRRYPDLAIHRILSEWCADVPVETIQKKFTGFAAGASVQSSDCEVRAMTAERDAEDCYKAEYMQQFIGKTLTGVISSITAFGVYVQLPNTVEGLVRVAALCQHPLTLTEGISLADPTTGRSWRLGDTMEVMVSAVDVSQGNIDFEPVRA